MSACYREDVKIEYEVQGEGEGLLFVMGFTGSRYQWRGFHERFIGTRRVIVMDNRGVGASDAPPGPYSTTQMAQDALAVLDHAGIERASVVGVSMGGMIAQQIALLAPGRVSRLVLGCTSAGGTSDFFSSVSAVWGTRSGRGPEERLRALIELNFSEQFLQERPDEVDAMIAFGLQNKMTPAGFQGQLAALASHDSTSRLHEIRCPTLVLTGDEDRLMPPSLSSALVERIPGARLQILRGAGHMFWVEQPDEFERMLRGFL